MAETKGMFNEEKFKLFKEGTVLLNFSRDNLVKDADLLAAIESGKIRKYVTDFPNDDLINQEHVICIPHLGASTEEAEDNCAEMAAQELMEYVEHGNITNSVNYPDVSLGEFIPGHGQRICILNKNIPTMLGKITGILADEGINIRDLVNKSKGDYACTLIDLDSDVDEAALREKLAIDGIIAIRVLK